MWEKFGEQFDPKQTLDYFKVMDDRATLTVRVNPSKISRADVSLADDKDLHAEVQLCHQEILRAEQRDQVHRESRG